jgi:hypothetical protein
MTSDIIRITLVKIKSLPTVSLQSQSRGIGIGMLQDAIRRTLLIVEQSGIRAMLSHPIDKDAAPFCKRFGFEASPLRQDQLLLLLKDAGRWINLSV